MEMQEEAPSTLEGAEEAQGSSAREQLDNTAEAGIEQVDFLRQYANNWLPSHYIQVVAITLDGKVKAETVRVDQLDGLAPFIVQHNGKANLYFCVNPLRRDPGTKASEADVAALAYIHVDHDPPKVELTPEELTRARAELYKAVDGFKRKPTVVIDSGNGYGGFWQLGEPIPHDGNTDELKAINKRLASYLGADHCQNIDRVMRLPGTLNLPSERKRELGRVPVPATLLYQNGNTYAPGDFAFLPAVPDKPSATVDIDPGAVDQVALAVRLAAVQTDMDLKALLAGQAPLWLLDRSGSGMDFALALTFERLHFSPAEQFVCLANYPHGKQDGRTAAYLNRTIAKVCAPPTAPAEPDPETSTWRTLTLEQGRTTDDDLHKVDPPWPHAIYPLRPSACVSILGGANGLGKSIEALSQDLHIATGRSYWGMPVKKGKAVFLSAEDPRPVIKARMQAWLEGIPEAERPAVERDIRENFFFFGNDETGGMQVTIKEFGECKPSREAVELLVKLGQGAVSMTVETVAMLNGGDEMNTDLMQMALALKEVARRTGASMQAIHHISKEAVGKVPTIYSLRGASALGDALRGATIMYELSPEQMHSLSITRIADAPVMGMVNVKASYAAQHPPFYIRRIPVDVQGVPAPRFAPVDASESRAKANERIRLLKFLQQPEHAEGLSLHQLQDTCVKFGIGKREIEGVLKRLELKGDVERVSSKDLSRKGPEHDIWRSIEPTAPDCATAPAQ